MWGRKLLPLVFLLGMVAMLIAGCEDSLNIEPRTIDPTLAECPICRMSIVDLHFAGQIINSNGMEDNFDDIGCLVLHLKRLGTGGQESLPAIYVKDFQTTQWISAQEAFYVQGRIDTPMSFGIVAFENREVAEELAAKISGKVISWEEVLRVKFDIGFEAKPEREREPRLEGSDR